MSAAYQLEIRFAAPPADKPSAYYKGDVIRIPMLDQQNANLAASKITEGRNGDTRMVHFLDESGLMWTVDTWQIVHARTVRFETAPVEPHPGTNTVTSGPTTVTTQV